MNQEAWESSQRGAKWLCAHMGADGSMQNGTDLRAYYKTPAALLASGHVVEADRVLNYVERELLLDNGDLRGDGVPWYPIFRTYGHGWLGCAAIRHGRFDIARRLADFVATFHDPASGGFYADEARTHCEIMTTSMAALLCLWTGRTQLALETGTFLRKLYEAQPDLKSGLYTRWQNGLVTQFPEAEAAAHLVDPKKTRQWYFQYGISAAFLSALSGATGDKAWLDLAHQFLAASDLAGPDRYQTPQAGKIGWGAAWAYPLSRSPHDRALSAKVSAALRALQNDDGSWLVTGVYGGESASPDSATIDITSEFVTLQSFMALVPND